MRLIECEDEMYQLKFQFTHPGKGATNRWERGLLPIEVSIHAPWEGCDTPALNVDLIGHNVSIHAPWEGCDV